MSSLRGTESLLHAPPIFLGAGQAEANPPWLLRESPDVDAVLFTSPTTVESARRNGLIETIRERGLVVGGVGPATAKALAREALPVDIRPTGYGPERLARATLLHFAFARP